MQDAILAGKKINPVNLLVGVDSDPGDVFFFLQRMGLLVLLIPFAPYPIFSICKPKRNAGDPFGMGDENLI